MGVWSEFISLDRWPAVVNKVMDPRVPQNAVNILLSWLVCQSLRQLVQAVYKKNCVRKPRTCWPSLKQLVWQRVVSNLHHIYKNTVHNVKCEIHEWKYVRWSRRLEQLCSAKQPRFELTLLTAQNGSTVLFLQNMSTKYTMMMMAMSRSSKVWATSPRRHRPCSICLPFKRHQQLESVRSGIANSDNSFHGYSNLIW